MAAPASSTPWLATTAAAGGSGLGGAIYASSPTVLITNCTLSGNVATGGMGGAPNGATNRPGATGEATGGAYFYGSSGLITATTFNTPSSREIPQVDPSATISTAASSSTTA